MLRTKADELAALKRSLPPECLEDYSIIFDGPSPQHLLFTEIPYFDHNNSKKVIVCAVYNVVHKTLPSSLPTLLPPPPPAYELRDIPGKGKGLIATRDIALNELVIVERPVMLFPLVMSDIGSAVKVEDFQTHAKRMMNREDWIKFNDLSDVQTKYVSSFDGIRNTNAFDIRDLQTGKEDYSGIFLEQSRLNHSCGPNLRGRWDPHLFTLSVQAARPIHAGQELTVSYLSIFSPYADRQSTLRDVYKFKCKCPCCVKSSPTSDFNRQLSLPDITRSIFDLKYNLLNRRPQAIELRNNLIGRLVTITKEGVESVAAPIVYVCLMKISGIMGDKKEFIKWGFKAILSSVSYTERAGGKMYSEVETWIDWMRDPEKTFPEWGRYKYR